MTVLTLIEFGRSNEPHQTQSAQNSVWHVLKHLIDVSLVFMVRVLFLSCVRACDTKGKIRSESSFKGRHSPFWPRCLDLLLLQIPRSETKQWEQPWARHSVLARLRKSVWSFGFCWQSYCEAGWGALKHLPRSCGWPPELFLGTHFLSPSDQAPGSVGPTVGRFNCLWCLETPDRAVTPMVVV